jgi:hypothetical protein
MVTYLFKVDVNAPIDVEDVLDNNLISILKRDGAQTCKRDSKSDLLHCHSNTDGLFNSWP